MRFTEDGYRIEIWTEVDQFDGLAKVLDRLGKPVVRDPLMFTVHVDVERAVEQIDVEITVGGSEQSEL